MYPDNNGRQNQSSSPQNNTDTPLELVGKLIKIVGWPIIIPFVYFSIFMLFISGMEDSAWRFFPASFMIAMYAGFFITLILGVVRVIFYYQKNNQNSTRSSANGDEDKTSGGLK